MQRLAPPKTKKPVSLNMTKRISLPLPPRNPLNALTRGLLATHLTEAQLSARSAYLCSATAEPPRSCICFGMTAPLIYRESPAKLASLCFVRRYWPWLSGPLDDHLCSTQVQYSRKTGLHIPKDWSNLILTFAKLETNARRTIEWSMRSLLLVGHLVSGLTTPRWTFLRPSSGT